jgi:hypothetical protein
MSYPFMLSGDEVEDGKPFRGGEGRAGAVYSWKGRQLPGKMLSISPDIAFQGEKLHRVAFRVNHA